MEWLGKQGERRKETATQEVGKVPYHGAEISASYQCRDLSALVYPFSQELGTSRKEKEKAEVRFTQILMSMNR